MKNITITPQMAGDNATPIIEKIIADAPDGVTVQNNQFANCHNSGKGVIIQRCDNVVCQNNNKI